MPRAFNSETIVPLYLSAVQQERGESAAENDGRWLRCFLEQFGSKPISSIDPKGLIGFRTQLASSYKASTVNQYLGAALRFVRWAAALGYREPIDLGAVKFLRVDPPKKRAWSVAKVCEVFGKADRFFPPVAPMLRVQYLACLRPSEVVRLVNGEGEWEEEGVFIPATSKTFRRTGFERRLILPETALATLGQVEVRYKNFRTYWNSCNKATGVGPHQLRHSGATRLAQRRSYETVKWFLGHYGSDQTTLRYAMPDWQQLREDGEVLAQDLKSG